MLRSALLPALIVIAYAALVPPAQAGSEQAGLSVGATVLAEPCRVSLTDGRQPRPSAFCGMADAADARLPPGLTAPRILRSGGGEAGTIERPTVTLAF